MKKLLLSIAFLLPGMGMMAQRLPKVSSKEKTSQASQYSRVFRSLPLR